MENLNMQKSFETQSQLKDKNVNDDKNVENSEENQLCKVYDIKSSAIVKHESFSRLTEFNLVQPETNLNKPPKNWLRASSKWESFVRDVSMRRQHLFSSFDMAHRFPESVGEIDVITDSENVKRLLKIPFNKAPVSMIVHKIGKTVLIDDFDVHKHILRKQQSDWEWMKKFYYETILKEMSFKLANSKQPRTREQLHDLNMFSKFLYYSAPLEKNDDIHDNPTHTVTDLDSPKKYLPGFDLLLEHEPEKLEYQRTCVWSFEDLKMLIGTDLPIFGDETHPCVSLRLRDTEKPITVLTGIDYWLDNLMCNVPELAMCYHLNGIVQNYSLYKTEDIPHFENSKFSPKVIKDIAQNILMFLKTNATKEGRTYWLFKGENDDYVKLYDLTSLCQGDRENNMSEDTNPFTVPVAVLLYRVARNMMHTNRKKKSNAIRMLLKNCLKLINSEQHSQIVTSAHYLLSELYIGDQSDDDGKDNMENDLFDDDDNDDENNDDNDSVNNFENFSEDESEPTLSRVSIKQLLSGNNTLSEWPKTTSSNQKENQYKKFSSNLKYKCKKALRHLIMAFKVLGLNLENLERLKKHTIDEQIKCNPSKPIPLHYKPLVSEKNERGGGDSIVTCRLQENWHKKLKCLLLAKSAKCYTDLAHITLSEKLFGDCLYFIKTALHCFETCQVPLLPENDFKFMQSSRSQCLGILGDVLVMIERFIRDGESVNRYLKTTEFLNDIKIVDNDFILNLTLTELKEFAFEWVDHVFKNLCSETILLHAADCYQEALKSLTKEKPIYLTDKDLMKRAGNVCNELGMLFMYKAKSIFEEGINEVEFRKYANKAIDCFDRGLKAFEDIDFLNKSILHNNSGTISRLCAEAQSHFRKDQHEFSPSEGKYFQKSAKHFENALRCLKEVSDFKDNDVIDNIKWNLSSTYFTMGTLMQDNAPLSIMAEEQVENEVTRCLLLALEYCQVDITSVKYSTCQYRCGTIHHRLASLYHNTVRNNTTFSDRQKKLKQNLNEHYNKAFEIFQELESSTECIRVLLERIAFCEFTLKHQTEYSTKMATLKSAILYCFNAVNSLTIITQQLTEDHRLAYQENSSMSSNIDENEITKLEAILRSRLLASLLSIVQLSSTFKGRQAPTSEQIQSYKDIYKRALKATVGGKNDTLKDRCNQLLNCLLEIKILLDFVNFNSS